MENQVATATHDGTERVWIDVFLCSQCGEDTITSAPGRGYPEDSPTPPKYCVACGVKFERYEGCKIVWEEDEI